MIELSRYLFENLRTDEEFNLYRGRSRGEPSSILVLVPVLQQPRLETVKRLEHECSIEDQLDPEWSVRPLGLTRHWDRTVLVLQDPGGEPLESAYGRFGPAAAGAYGREGDGLELRFFLQVAGGMANVIARLHGRGIIHKDIKPANFLISSATGQVWLTGFGIASRLAREKQAAEPAEMIAGTPAYMAPEQTGRVNRSIDSRSDLYSLGVTFYQMLTGGLPFAASEPMEWVHCHVARRPVPPGERRGSIPDALSAIIMKLLSKMAEDRYQTAAGLGADLRKCLAEWERHGRISSFSLGLHDVSDQLLLAEKLYGRDRELETLLDAFDQVVATGKPKLVLVSGYSGIGKSSVINELHKALVLPPSRFVSGKFDPYKRDIPYATLGPAFQSLILPLLGKNEAELRRWRDALRDALGANGQLIVDLVPELKLIIGEQPPASDLPRQDAQRRFQLVLRRFIGVFARPEHPLVLFVDDLQWSDTATLDLLEDLLTQPDVQHLMLIGAYRDNEVNSAHPLTRKLAKIRQGGDAVQEIVLEPLADEDLEQLVADGFHCDTERARPLARLVHEKTAGNPFFAIQFIHTLVEEKLLTLDQDNARWCWDLNRIQAKGYTDNVVDLMVGKLNRLPVETQRVLQEFACLGNRAEIATLSIVHGTSEAEVESDLWAAVRLGFILRSEGFYDFVHDRVREAAYALIPEGSRAKAHLRIGRVLLFSSAAAKETQEKIFGIANQLNRGVALITAAEERERVAELNLIAGRRAKSSTAYAAALGYLVTGCALLPEYGWEQRYALTFALEFERAECEFLTGDFAAAEERLSILSERVGNPVDRAAVTCLRAELYMTLDRTNRAVEVCLEYLRRIGIEWSPNPTKEEVEREYAKIWRQLDEQAIEQLVDLPLMTDPDCRATLDVLSVFSTPAWFADENLPDLIGAHMVNLSLEHGNCDASCHAYAVLGTMMGAKLRQYRAGFRFGKLAVDLTEKHGLHRFKGRVYNAFGHHIAPWAQHLRDARIWNRRAFRAAKESGDLTYAAFSSSNMIANLLAGGDPLEEVQRQAEEGIEFARKIRFELASDYIIVALRLIRTLRGLTPKFGSFNDAEFDESWFEQRLGEHPRLAPVACRYWIRKLQALFHAQDYEGAIAAAAKAHSVQRRQSFFEVAEYPFYSALAHAALCNSAFADERARHLEAVATHYGQLAIWKENCPENFGSCAALVGAEMARIEGRELDAERLYEEAIQSARKHGFTHNEAIAHEVAARFYSRRSLETIARAYLRNARYCYLRWGAAAKVRQLEELYPEIAEKESVPGPASTIGASVERLDLATVIKVSQAVSGEIVLEKLMDTIMRKAIEHAGAQRGLLILPRGNEQQIEAEATTSGDTIIVRLREASLSEALLPESIVHYVVRTRENVILDDASDENPFSADTYIRQHHSRSILLLPLVSQAKLIGLLYLENNLAPHVFTSARIAVLKFLASQAAISLENTHLYRDLKERETKIRRLFDANIMGVFIWKFEGRIIEANEAFLHMVNFSREDLRSGRLSWKDLTPPEWRDLADRAVAQLKATGALQPYEKEYFRNDGSRVPVLVGSALFEGSNDEGVAFVLDLSEQKRAEAALRRSEAYLAEAQRLSRTGSFGWNVSSGKIYWSQETYRIFGYGSATEPTLERVLDRTYPEDKTSVQKAFDRISQEKKDFDVEHRLLMPDGSVKYVRVVGRASKEDESGNFEFVGAVTDITESKRAEQALRKAQAELAHVTRVATLGELAGSIAHEISQPLGAITNNVHAGLRFLASGSENLEEVKAALSDILKGADRVNGIIIRMRALAKKLPPEMARMDFTDVVSDVLTLIHHELTRRRVEIELEISRGLPPVLADRVQLQQVLLNLVMNGVEAMSEITGDRKISIRADPYEHNGSSAVLVSVQDSGPGLKQVEVDRLFEAFYTTKSQGLGMGLAISRSIVEAHGGRLWVASAGGPGATFQFVLPAEDQG